jgi:hypothetical protein
VIWLLLAFAGIASLVEKTLCTHGNIFTDVVQPNVGSNTYFPGSWTQFCYSVVNCSELELMVLNQSETERADAITLYSNFVHSSSQCLQQHSGFPIPRFLTVTEFCKSSEMNSSRTHFYTQISLSAHPAYVFRIGFGVFANVSLIMMHRFPFSDPTFPVPLNVQMRSYPCTAIALQNSTVSNCPISTRNSSESTQEKHTSSFFQFSASQFPSGLAPDSHAFIFSDSTLIALIRLMGPTGTQDLCYTQDGDTLLTDQISRILDSWQHHCADKPTSSIHCVYLDTTVDGPRLNEPGRACKCVHFTWTTCACVMTGTMIVLPTWVWERRGM